MNQLPSALGLFLCEQVIVEEKTRNVTVVNCFSHRVVQNFPSEPMPFVAFALLTDGLGKMPLEIIIERLDTMEEINRLEFMAQFPDPLQTLRFVARIRRCSFPVAGQFQVSLLANHELLAQRKMTIYGKETHL